MKDVKIDKLIAIMILLYASLSLNELTRVTISIRNIKAISESI